MVVQGYNLNAKAMPSKRDPLAAVVAAAALIATKDLPGVQGIIEAIALINNCPTKYTDKLSSDNRESLIRGKVCTTYQVMARSVKQIKAQLYEVNFFSLYKLISVQKWVDWYGRARTRKHTHIYIYIYIYIYTYIYIYKPIKNLGYTHTERTNTHCMPTKQSLLSLSVCLLYIYIYIYIHCPSACRNQLSRQG